MKKVSYELVASIYENGMYRNSRIIRLPQEYMKNILTVDQFTTKFKGKSSFLFYLEKLIELPSNYKTLSIQKNKGDRTIYYSIIYDDPLLHECARRAQVTRQNIEGKSYYPFIIPYFYDFKVKQEEILNLIFKNSRFYIQNIYTTEDIFRKNIEEYAILCEKEEETFENDRDKILKQNQIEQLLYVYKIFRNTIKLSKRTQTSRTTLSENNILPFQYNNLKNKDQEDYSTTYIEDEFLTEEEMLQMISYDKGATYSYKRKY